MKKIIVIATSIILAMVIMATTIFGTIVITEAKYLPVKDTTYSLTVNKKGEIEIHENLYLDWSGSYAEAILVKADAMTNHAFNLVDGLN